MLRAITANDGGFRRVGHVRGAAPAFVCLATLASTSAVARPRQQRPSGVARAPGARPARPAREGDAPHSCATYAPPPLPSDVLDRVRDEGVQVRVRRLGEPGSPLRIEIRALAHFDAPGWLVWRVVRDYAAYAKFLPRVATSEVIRRAGQDAEPRLEIDVPWPLADVDTHTRNVHERCGPDHWLLRWRRIGGTVAENRGVSVIYHAPSGATLMRQRLVVGTDTDLPDAYALRGTRRYFHYLLAALREQVARARVAGWYGPPPAPPATARRQRTAAPP